MLRRLITTLLALTLTLFTQFTYADYDFVARPDVQAFIHMMATKYGFDAGQLLSLFNDVKLRHQVINQINRPLESQPWYLYQMLFINDWRIEHGVTFWNRYADALARADKLYGVPPSIIVATLGAETKYGKVMGDFRVIDTLSNLAFSASPRAPYFRQELAQFLLLARDQHVNPRSVYGSYAGAIGEPQFMPSSYRYYAVDFSGNGHIDLAHDSVDAIGSIANYYKQHGWQANTPVVVRAQVIGDRYDYLAAHGDLPAHLTIAELGQYGVIPTVKIAQENVPVTVIELQGRFGTEYWLGFQNFSVIKRYNNSDLYAMAVYQLGNEIAILRNH